MSVTLFCLGKKAFVSLNGLKEELISIIDCIVIGSDKNIKKDYSDEIKKWAKKYQIKAINRTSFDYNLNTSNYHIVIGWRWMNKTSKDQKLIVIHDSLLPKYRGFNSLVTALIRGDTEIGVTALFGANEYDKGDIITQENIRIKYPIKIGEAIDKIALLYKKILSNLLLEIFYGNSINGFKQDDLNATYSLWRDEEDYRINWNESAKEIKRFIDAVGFPYKGALSYINNEKIRIKEAEIEQDVIIANRDTGKIIFKKDNKPVVVCGIGLIKIIEAFTENGEKKLFKNQFRIRFH